MARSGKWAIKGNTYYVKEDLKRLGARWDPNRKVWWVDGNDFTMRGWSSFQSSIYRMNLRLERMNED